jgi:hypothetical protein
MSQAQESRKFKTRRVAKVGYYRFLRAGIILVPGKKPNSLQLSMVHEVYWINTSNYLCPSQFHRVPVQ